MPLPTQAKILRVLTDQTFVRVGGTKQVKVNIRVISASAQDLQAAIQHQTFREDLYHRLNVVPVKVPSLSDRREDIPELVEHFLEILSAAIGRSKRGITDDALSTLQATEWPGNVRQLRNIIERMVILGSENPEESIDSSMLPPELKQKSSDLLASETNGVIMTVPLREAREEFEREYLRIQIMRFSGNISRTATFIGMERSALHRKLKTLGLSSNGRDRNIPN